MSRANPRFHRNNPPGTAVGPGGIARYKIVGAIEGQMTVSIFDMVSTVSTIDLTHMTTLISNLSANIMIKYSNCISADWSLTYERLDLVHRNDVQGLTYLGGVPRLGQRPAGHEPTEVSQPIIKYTALKGQHGRGRISLPAIASSDVVGSKITNAACLTAINNLVLALVGSTSDGTNNWTMCVSTRSPITKLAAFFTATSSAAMSPLLGTIRRRKIGRGK